MLHCSKLAFAFAAVLLISALRADAAIVYVESVNGDMSGNGLAPTSISVGLGSNEIQGSTGRTVETGTDRDYFAITVPTGFQIIALIEKAGTTTVGGVSFLAIEAGSQVTVPTNAQTAAGLLGWIHYFAVSQDTDILADVGLGGFESTGFIPPLPAGDYAFWIQDTGLGSSSYGFDIVIAAPEPGTAAVALVGLLAVGLARARSWRR
jgi:hypothetical protein